MTVESFATVAAIRFGTVDVLVEVTPVKVVGEENTSAASRVIRAYEKAEEAILGIASAIAASVDALPADGRRPRELTVEFGLSVGGDLNVYVVKGSTEASLSVTLTYDVAS